MSSVNSVNSAELNAKSTFQRDYEQSSAFYKHEQPPQTRFNSLLKHPSQQAHSIKVRAQHSIYSTVLQITRAEFAKVTRMLLWKLRRNETVVVRLSVHFCTQKKPSTECKLQTWRTLVRLMTHETFVAGLSLRNRSCKCVIPCCRVLQQSAQQKSESVLFLCNLFRKRRTLIG